MMRGLLEKELRQHGFTLAVLCIVLPSGLILIDSHGTLARLGGGGFAILQLLLISFVPPACLVLGQILIATEFRRKTQLFLEALPMPRWAMLAIKFALGLFCLMTAIGFAATLAWWRARHSEAMTPRFALLVALKSAGWVWFFYTLCFAHAFLGRYRLVFGVAKVFGLIFASQAGVELSSFGPFALVGGRFAYERMIFPGQALAVTVALGLGFAALAFCLGLMRDASVAALLAEKMSGREKVVMAMLVVGGITGIGLQLERRSAVTPIRMPGSVESQHGVVLVVASAAVDAPSRAETAVLESTTRRVADELGELAEYLGCKTFPPVFIVHRRDLGPEELVDGELKPTQGVLVRANLTATGFREAELQSWLVRHTLLTQSGTLAGNERNAWVLDGFVWWWPKSQHAKTEALDEAARAGVRSAAAGDFQAQQLRAWYSTRNKLGEENARQVAGTELAVLAQRKGAETCRRFLSAMLGPRKPVDIRGWWRDVTHPAPRTLHATTGWTEAELVSQWREALASSAAPQP